jgi:hypothetical protein
MLEPTVQIFGKIYRRKGNKKKEMLKFKTKKLE